MAKVRWVVSLFQVFAVHLVRRIYISISLTLHLDSHILLVGMLIGTSILEDGLAVFNKVQHVCHWK